MIFVTGATGYLGGYTVADLLARTDERLALLVRGKDRRDAAVRVWQSLQLHLTQDEFAAALPRLDWVLGDLHERDLGIAPPERARLVEEVDSVLHVAASLNRKSEKACLNTNLRGTLSVLQLGRALKKLRRFTFVSTVAVAGKRDREVVDEDHAVEWERSDYDPYGRTKKFCEHLVRELLPAGSFVIARPSAIIGDSRFPETNQFDMVQALGILAEMPLVPVRPDTRIDIVNADFVSRALSDLHMAKALPWDTFHLSAGTASPTARSISEGIARALDRKPLRFAPGLGRSFEVAFRAMNRLPRGKAQIVGAVMKVFWPYITYDTVFTNDRVVTATGEAPTPFGDYCGPLYRWCRDNQYRYPVRPLSDAILSEIPA